MEDRSGRLGSPQVEGASFIGKIAHMQQRLGGQMHRLMRGVIRPEDQLPNFFSHETETVADFFLHDNVCRLFSARIVIVTIRNRKPLPFSRCRPTFVLFRPPRGRFHEAL